MPCATCAWYGVTHDRGDASAVSIAGPSAGSCGMDVHFPSSPLNVHPWYPHSISPRSLTRPSESGTSRCGHLSAVHLYGLVPAAAVWSFQNTRGSPSNVKVYGASSLRSASNATGYQLRCQSKSPASESTGAAEAEAGGSTIAVGTSDAPRTAAARRAPREAAGRTAERVIVVAAFSGRAPVRRRARATPARGATGDARRRPGATRVGAGAARGAKAGDASIDIFDGTGRW